MLLDQPEIVLFCVAVGIAAISFAVAACKL
jgi:hypothetical protein